MHRIVPTSDWAKGLKSLSTISLLPVFSPGSRTEVPENTSISIGFDSYAARPTSRSALTGSPISGVEEDLGTNRTSREKEDMALMLCTGEKAGRARVVIQGSII